MISAAYSRYADGMSRLAESCEKGFQGKDEGLLCCLLTAQQFRRTRSWLSRSTKREEEQTAEPEDAAAHQRISFHLSSPSFPRKIVPG